MLLAPDGDHLLKPGEWAVDSTHRVVPRTTADGTTTAFRIASLSQDLLRLIPFRGPSNP
jgi:hypothetical protein